MNSKIRRAYKHYAQELRREHPTKFKEYRPYLEEFL